MVTVIRFRQLRKGKPNWEFAWRDVSRRSVGLENRVFLGGENNEKGWIPMGSMYGIFTLTQPMAKL